MNLLGDADRNEDFKELYRHLEATAIRERRKFKQESFADSIDLPESSRSEISKWLNDKKVIPLKWWSRVKEVYEEDLELLRIRNRMEAAPLERSGDAPAASVVRIRDWGTLPAEDWERPTGEKEKHVSVNAETASVGNVRFTVKGTSCRPYLKARDVIYVQPESTYREGMLTIVEKGPNVGVVFPHRNSDGTIQFEVVSTGYVGEPDGWKPIGYVEAIDRTMESGIAIVMKARDRGFEKKDLPVLPE